MSVWLTTWGTVTGWQTRSETPAPCAGHQHPARVMDPAAVLKPFAACGGPAPQGRTPWIGRTRPASGPQTALSPACTSCCVRCEQRSCPSYSEKSAGGGRACRAGRTARVRRGAATRSQREQRPYSSADGYARPWSCLQFLNTVCGDWRTCWASAAEATRSMRRAKGPMGESGVAV